ncbi:fatty acid synthase S-acetyltransferase [Xylaria telfairii]|nr:fatty acid synthase S-acetyltransferase [Xylaria telfairii]
MDHSINGSLNAANEYLPPNGDHSFDSHKGNHQTATAAVNVNSNGSAYGETPIAICGIGLRLPGGISNPEQLWDLLVTKGSARCRVPASRYNVSAYYSTTGKPGTVATEYGYFLDESVDIASLDTSCFNVTRSELQQADPQQRLMLEVARECFDDAGLTGWRGKKIGCYIGNFGEDWAEMTSKETQHRGQYRITGTSDYIISNRISYEMDLQGPCMTIRTACSSALVALNEACMAISKGNCEAALVGGVNLILGPSMTIALTEQGVLSPTGSCKSFSADADGYARGEAATAIYIKPLADAIRDGNPVRAVIRATSHNFDGKTAGLSHPSEDAQEALIRRAYDAAGITDFGATGMVECHGTGTVKGDPIEARAVARIFGDEGVYIGSVKPNLGHSEGASGLTSIIKMALALEHRVIPPNIGFTAPNPSIPFETANLKVPLEPTPWPASKERASVSAFGIGGVNAHVILDSAASFGVRSANLAEPSRAQLLLYSANSARSVAQMPSLFADWVSKNPEKIGDLAYTLAFRRERLPHRCFALVDKQGAICTTSSPAKPPIIGKKPHNIVMVFTGQGAQWPLMGRELLQSSPVFKSSIQSLDKYLHAIDGEYAAGYSIEEEIVKPARKSRVGEAYLSQPLCTAVQVAVVDVLRSIGIEPAAVVGHSSGEIAAAYAAGALTAREAIITAHLRGAIACTQEKAGAMAAIGMGWDKMEEYLVPGVVLACDNALTSVTISGDAEAIRTVIKSVQGVRPAPSAKLLQVNKAYHSHHMAEIGEAYFNALTQHNVIGKQATTPFFSSVEGDLSNSIDFGARYWQDNLELPVRFRQAVSSILEHDIGKHALFLEVGPHSALAGPLRQIFTSVSSAAQYASIMTRNRDCFESLLNSVGKIWSLHIPVQLEALLESGRCLPDLPRYPWAREEGSYWRESRVSKEWRHRKHAHHELLGIRIPESSDIEPAWRNMFHLQDVAWVRDHRVGGDAVFPFAGYITIAGEAARQVSGVDEGFSIREMIVSAALILSEGEPTEILTTLRPHRVTDSLNSQWWWDFTIASHNGSTWTKHCAGEVRALPSASLGSALEAGGQLPRRLVPRDWYSRLYKSGLELGPAFQTFDSLESSVDSNYQSKALLTPTLESVDSYYHLHPTLIDGALQPLACAAVNGHARKLKLWLPKSIKTLSVVRGSPSSSPLQASATARITSNFSLAGEIRVTSGSAVVLEGSGLRMGIANGPEPRDGHGAARYRWAPDINFVDIERLIAPTPHRASQIARLNKTAKRILLSSAEEIRRSMPQSEHLQRYAAWVDSLAINGVSVTSENSYDVLISDAQVRAKDLPPQDVATVVLQQVQSNLSELVSGEQALHTLLPKDTMANLSDFVMNQANQASLLHYLAHSKSTLRVLHIEDERLPSTSEFTIKALALPGGKALRCSRLTITSKGYVAENAKETQLENVEYANLDISRDLGEQNFTKRRYDLVIASGIVRPVDDVGTKERLRNIKMLLARHGRLLLREIDPFSAWANLVFGSQQSWRWDGSSYDADYEWLKSELKSAGLEEIEAITTDSLSVTVVAKPLSTLHAELFNKSVTLLCRDYETVGEDIPRMEKLIDRQLREAGYEVTRCTLENEIPLEQDVLCLLDVKGPFFDTITPTEYESLKKFLVRMQDSSAGILWATMLCQMGSRDPGYASVIGFARVMRSELLLDFATCELESRDDNAIRLLVRVLEKFGDRRQSVGFEDDDVDSTLRPDFEYVVRHGQVNVGRYYPFTLRDELMTSELAGRAAVDIETPGRISTLRWEQRELEPLGSREVELEVHSAGVNFRDILVGLNIVELPVRQFGVEAAGVATRVGSDVSDIKVGDRVVCLKKQAFATKIVVEELACAKIPDSLSFDEAASMIFAFATAIHSLVNIGGLHKGQTVLIHSACGGVGLAAIQIAQMYEAKIYATVGNEEKTQFLMDNFGIPRNHIFNSRDESFATHLMRETGGEGVDLVLNSLSGELLHASWACVAQFGKMIEIGKRDLLGGGKIDMRHFLENRSYSCVDMDLLWVRRQVFKRLVRSIVEHYEDGHIKPVRPIKVFDAEKIQEAFRYMQQGQHIGRVCLSLRDSSGKSRLDPSAVPRRKNVVFDRAASYLLVGGLGGIGREVARWMVEHGASELIFLSRSACTDHTNEEFANELKSAGCRSVSLVAGDVTRSEDVARAIETASNTLKGVIQMSMVLRDGSFENMTFDDWHAAASPKIKGTWNLHNTTLERDLDFFVLFSSLSGAVGQRHQANYASANTFLDSFVQYRTSLGLPASSIGIGAVEDVGYISRTPQLLDRMKTNGFIGMTEQQLLDAVEVAVAKRSDSPRDQSLDMSFYDPNTFVLGLSNAGDRAVWKDDRRMGVYHHASSATVGAGVSAILGSDETIKRFLEGARADPSVLKTDEARRFLAVEIGKKLFSLLLKPENEDPNISLPLVDLGLDSLLAIELREWWRVVFGFDVSTLEIMGMGSLDALGQRAVTRLLELSEKGG